MMLRTLAMAALMTLAATAAGAQKIDAKGRCHDAKGHFAKMDVCKGSATSTTKTTTATAATGPAAGYKLDAKGRCHDAKGKMAKKEMCKA